MPSADRPAPSRRPTDQPAVDPAVDPAVRRTVIENCAVATVDARDTEYPSGHVVVRGRFLERVGPGAAPTALAGVTRRVDGTGHLLTPGLVNTHHHFFQWITRGRAPNSALHDWLTTLYPLWARMDERMTYAAAQGSLAMMVRGGVTTTADHPYLFPRGAGDLLDAEVRAAREQGVRLTLARGSMDLGASAGGLPPDTAVERTEDALLATEAAIDRYHDSAPDAMVRVAVAPTAPFAASTPLLRESAALARRRGVRLHLHAAETREEDAYCRRRFGLGPLAYLESTGWCGADVWLAHCVHLDDADLGVLARTGTGVAHCPSSNARLAAGVARVPELLAAGVPVGLGVDGATSNESGELHTELRNALLINRLGAARHRSASPGEDGAGGAGGAGALGVRQALRLGTHGGARVLGRAEEIGSLEVGKLADLALWRIDGLGHASVLDPVAALVLGPAAPLTLLLVGGVPVVEDGRLTTVDEEAVARATRDEAHRLARLG